MIGCWGVQCTCLSEISPFSSLILSSYSLRIWPCPSSSASTLFCRHNTFHVVRSELATVVQNATEWQKAKS